MHKKWCEWDSLQLRGHKISRGDPTAEMHCSSIMAVVKSIVWLSKETAVLNIRFSKPNIQFGLRKTGLSHHVFKLGIPPCVGTTQAPQVERSDEILSVTLLRIFGRYVHRKIMFRKQKYCHPYDCLTQLHWREKNPVLDSSSGCTQRVCLVELCKSGDWIPLPGPQKVVVPGRRLLPIPMYVPAEVKSNSLPG